MLFIKKYYFQALCYLIVTLILLFSWSILKSEIQFAFNEVWKLYHGETTTGAASIEAFNEILQPDDEQNSEQTEPLGTIQVTTDGANIRTAPDINDTTVAYIATKGDQFYYYEQKEVDGTTWYKIIDSKTQDQFWISSKTVKSIE